MRYQIAQLGRRRGPAATAWPRPGRRNAIKGRSLGADLKITTHPQMRAGRVKLARNRLIQAENGGVMPERTTRYPCYALPGEATGPLASFVARPEGGRKSPSAKR